MQIIQSIAAWAAQQPAWFDDAVRRLMAGDLTPQDFLELPFEGKRLSARVNELRDQGKP